MAQLVKNIAGGTPLAAGGIYGAPIGTALPTDTAVALNAAFTPYGYVDEKGLQPSGSGDKYDGKIAWGGDTVATVLKEKSVRAWKFGLLEILNPDVNKLLYGSTNVTVTPAVVGTGTKQTILDKGDEIPHMSWVFDMRWGALGKRLRFVVADGQLAFTDEDPYVHDNITMYSCELTAFPDSAGVRVYRYLVNDDKL